MSTKHKTIKSYKDFDIVLREKVIRKRIKTRGFRRLLEILQYVLPKYTISYSFTLDAVAKSKKGLKVVDKIKEQLKNERN